MELRHRLSMEIDGAEKEGLVIPRERSGNRGRILCLLMDRVEFCSH